MTLYEYDQRILALIDEDTGEVKDYDVFLELNMGREEKIEATALYIKDLEGDAKKIKDEIAALQARLTPLQNKANRLREYLTRSLKGQKFSTPRCAISFCTSRALEVDDAVEAAQWLENNGHRDLVVYDAPKLDKRMVKQLVDGGENIPGVKVEKRQSLQVR